MHLLGTVISQRFGARVSVTVLMFIVMKDNVSALMWIKYVFLDNMAEVFLGFVDNPLM